MNTTHAHMLRPFDFLVFIGRFQPFHIAHMAILEKALDEAAHVLVLVGSAHQPRDHRNPFTFEERARMISGSVNKKDRPRVLITPIVDVAGDDARWVHNVKATVQGIVCQYACGDQTQTRIGLIGHDKDHSSYYLNMFPAWDSIDAPSIHPISSTQIRDAYFQVPQALKELRGYIPQGAQVFLSAFSSTDAYRSLRREYGDTDRESLEVTC